MYTKLFEPWLLGPLQISNRIILAPMGAHLGTEEGFASERTVAFYEARARGGVGLITIERMATW